MVGLYNGGPSYRRSFLFQERTSCSSSVADPDPGLGAFLTPGSGIRDGRMSASGSGIRDEQPGSYFFELRNHFFAFLGVKILKFFDEDLGSGIWDGDSSSGIRDKHPRSATLCTSKLEISSLFSAFVVHFCPHGSGSGFNADLDPDPTDQNQCGSETLKKHKHLRSVVGLAPGFSI